MEIQQRIQGLPKELQTYIYEYNPEHRYYRKKLNTEFINIIYPPCKMCNTPFNSEFCIVDYFISQKYNIYCHWCTIDCFHEDPDSTIKLKCLTAIENYRKKQRN